MNGRWLIWVSMCAAVPAFSVKNGQTAPDHEASFKTGRWPSYLGARNGGSTGAVVGLEARWTDFGAGKRKANGGKMNELSKKLASLARPSRGTREKPLVFLRLTPGNLDDSGLAQTEEIISIRYNRWFAWLHEMVIRLGPQVDVWILDLKPAKLVAPFDPASPFYSQLLKSSATELRGTDRGCRVLWRTDVPKPVAPWWPRDAIAYYDGLEVAADTDIQELRNLLPRRDFELWLRRRKKPPEPLPETLISLLLSGHEKGSQVLFWKDAGSSTERVTQASRVAQAIAAGDWTPGETVLVEAPPGVKSHVLLDSKKRDVRIVLLNPQGALNRLEIGVGKPSEALYTTPLGEATGELEVGRSRGNLVLTGFPAAKLLVVDLKGALPPGFQVTTTASAGMTGREIIARTEAYWFWLRRTLPQLAARIEIDWQLGEAVGFMVTEMLYEPASTTLWLEILEELEQGLPINPNKRRYMFFERGGGVSVPLVQAVDEDHRYTRLPDVRRNGKTFLAVRYTPRSGVETRTRGMLLIDPDSYAVAYMEDRDPKPPFPSTSLSTEMSFSEKPGGFWLPNKSREIRRVALLGLSFTLRSKLRFYAYDLAVRDLATRVEKSLRSANPVLVWNEARDEFMVLRKKNRPRKPKKKGPKPKKSPRTKEGVPAPHERSKEAPPTSTPYWNPEAAAPIDQVESPPEGQENDYLMRMAFGQSLELEATATAKKVEQLRPADAVSPSLGRADSLRSMARRLGNVELVRGGDAKRVGTLFVGGGYASGDFAPILLYSRLYLEWLGKRDWQFVIFTAGIFNLLRWTDTSLFGSRWNGSVTTLLPLLPFPDAPEDRFGKDVDEEEMWRFFPSLEFSARRALWGPLNIEFAAVTTWQFFGESGNTADNFIVPSSHLETRFRSRLELSFARSRVAATAELGTRTSWNTWGYGTEKPSADFQRYRIAAAHSFRLGRTGILQIAGGGGGGNHLDRFTAFGPGQFDLDSIGSRFVPPTSPLYFSRFGSLEGSLEATVKRKIRLGLEAAYLAGSDEDLFLAGVKNLGENRGFASAGVTFQFNSPWNTRALLRVGNAWELGEEGPSSVYATLSLIRPR